MYDITYNRFPHNEDRKLVWAKAVRRESENGRIWMPGPRDVLCSEHFKDEEFDKTGQTRRLKRSAVPSLFDYPPHLQVNILPGIL